MCEANVYLIKNGKEELVLKEVDVITLQDNGLFMKSIFGEQKILEKTRIKEINLVNHKIVIEKI
jgi:predicted RNA-binding protein